MAKSLITILYLVSIMNVSNGQNINLQDLNFIENKIKSNYPSYSNKVNSNYSKILRSAKKNIGKRSNSILNFSQLAIPVLFFKDLHLMLSNLKPISFDSTFCKNKLMEVESKSIKIREFKNGYWKSDYNDCIIYLQECGDKHNLYEAILIESTNKEIKLGSIKFYITKHKFDNYHVTNYINSKGNMFAIYSNSYLPTSGTCIYDHPHFSLSKK